MCDHGFTSISESKGGAGSLALFLPLNLPSEPLRVGTPSSLPGVGGLGGGWYSPKRQKYFFLTFFFFFLTGHKQQFVCSKGQPHGFQNHQASKILNISVFVFFFLMSQ